MKRKYWGFSIRIFMYPINEHMIQAEVKKPQICIKSLDLEIFQNDQ